MYSLGVIVYQMLTGEFPYRVVGTMREVQDQIIHAEPLRPRTAISSRDSSAPPLRGSVASWLRRSFVPSWLRRSAACPIDDEVETIVLKCLSKERERRYQTAGELARDIRHYLAGEPIEAKRDSTWYVMRKSLRRHRAKAAAGAAIMILTIASAAGMTVMYGRAVVGEESATRQAQTARQIQTFLEKVFTAIDPDTARGDDTTLLRRILDEAAERLQRELGDEPAIQAALHDTIGEAYARIGEFQSAERHIRSALQLREGLFGHEHLEVAQSLNDLGGVLNEKSDYMAAEPLLAEAVRIRRKLSSPSAALAESLKNLGYSLSKMARLPEAEPVLEEALSRYHEAYGDEHGEIAAMLDLLGSLNLERDRYEQAQSLFRRSLEMSRKLFGSDHPAAVRSLQNLGFMLNARGRCADAEPVLREAVERRRQVLLPRHPVLAVSLNNLGFTQLCLGRTEDAEGLFREALEIWQSHGERHADMVLALMNLGDVHFRRDDLENSEKLLHQALTICDEVFKDSVHPLTVTCRANIGAILNRQHKYTEAGPCLSEALRVRRAISGDRDDDGVAYSYNNLAFCLQGQKRYEEAESNYRQAIEV